VFVSDYSADGTDAWLMGLAAENLNVRIELEPMTTSLAGNWNLGIQMAKASGCDTYLVCNNDIIFHPVTIDAFRSRFAEGDVSMVTAHNVRGTVDPDRLHLLTPPARPTEAESPDFSCFMLDDDTLVRVGLFDEKFQPCYFEDNDYHWRLRQAGLKAVSTTAAPYYHFGSQTQNSVPGGLCPPSKFDQNRSYFIAKHGVDPATYEPI
jgi:GT2 family glycosyltransferase